MHPADSGQEREDEMPAEDVLPVPDAQGQRGAVCRNNVLVAVTGTELDHELVALACSLAKRKRMEVYAVYGIEVPRTLAVDAEMPEQTRHANDALNGAVAIATQLQVRIEAEIIQSRHFGQSLVEESLAHSCALIVIGLPYQVGRQGHFDLGETAEFILKNAPCRVWLVRGQPAVAEGTPGGAATEERRERQQATV